MDEEELEQYLDAIDSIDPLLQHDPRPIDGTQLLHEQVRDERGFRVPGCYFIAMKEVEF